MQKQQSLLLLVSPVNLSAVLPVGLVGEDILMVQSSGLSLYNLPHRFKSPSPCLVKGQQSFIVTFCPVKNKLLL